MWEERGYITLVSLLLNIKPYQAAKYINDNLGLGLDFKGKTDEIKINRYKQKQIAKQQFALWENRTFQTLCNSIHKMNFVEKDQNLSIIDYYLEAFICGTDEEKIELYKDSSFRKKVDQLAKRYG